MSNTVCIQTFGTEIDAEIAKEILKANGIKAAIVADDLGGGFPQLSGDAKLMVMEEDADLAREILNSSSRESEE
jgi:hypothetical protein